MLVAKRCEDEASRLRREAEPEVDDIAKRRTSRSGAAAEDITKRSSEVHHEVEQQLITSRSGAAVDHITKRSSG